MQHLDVSDNPVGIDFAIALSAAATNATNAVIAAAAAAAADGVAAGDGGLGAFGAFAAAGGPPTTTTLTVGPGGVPQLVQIGAHPGALMSVPGSRMLSRQLSRATDLNGGEPTPVAQGPASFILADTNMGADGMQVRACSCVRVFGFMCVHVRLCVGKAKGTLCRCRLMCQESTRGQDEGLVRTRCARPASAARPCNPEQALLACCSPADAVRRAAAVQRPYRADVDT